MDLFLFEFDTTKLEDSIVLILGLIIMVHILNTVLRLTKHVVSFDPHNNSVKKVVHV